ncbi:membrane protein [Actinotalea ferrariae CF5-4]|uniref:Membrane protein n=1 Tax=Actinotalea ferrariae CF5-4 TaxID=948458 RepID=A0A021VR22_9CELL|nr:membrane protein [Actinotalea ferrariae CF5-4]
MTAAAAAVAAVLLLGLVVFQVALAAGAPWGRAAYGGAAARLPRRLRVTSAVAAAVWAGVLLVVLRRAGLDVWAPLPDPWLPAATIAVVAVLVVACVLNAITPSRLERALWLPVSVLLLAACATVALTA